MSSDSPARIIETVIADFKGRAGTLLQRASAEDIPVIQESLRYAAVEHAAMLAAPTTAEADQHRANASHSLGTLRSIAARYSVDAAGEARAFLGAVVDRGINALITAAFAAL